MPTLLRRSKRPSLPNNDVIIRRSFIRDIYAKKENAKKHKIQKTAKNGTIKNGLVRKQKVQRKRKNKTNPEQPSQSNCAKACDNIKMSPTSQSAIEDSIKKENQDDEDNTTEDPGILEPFGKHKMYTFFNLNVFFWLLNSVIAKILFLFWFR